MARAAAVTVLLAALAWNAHAQFDNPPSPAQPDNPIDKAAANPARDNGAAKILQGRPLRLLGQRPLREGDAQSGVAQTRSLSSIRES